MAEPSRHDDLERAYRATSYFVDAPTGRLTIRIGDMCPALDAILQEHGASCWSFITAFNPGSARLPNAENLRRQARLAESIASAGHAALPAESVADADDWPSEKSLLVIGMAETAGVALAREFGQAAIVVGDSGGRAKLVWVEDHLLA